MTRRRLLQGMSGLSAVALLVCGLSAAPLLLDPTRLGGAGQTCDGVYPWTDAVGFTVVVVIAFTLLAGAAALLRRLRNGGGPIWLVAAGLLVGLLALSSALTAPEPVFSGSGGFGSCEEPSLARPYGLTLLAFGAIAVVRQLWRRQRTPER